MLARRIAVEQLRAAYEQHERFAVAQGDSCDLSLGHGVGHVHELVPPRIVKKPEGRDMAAERHLELRLESEHQLSHLGVQPVGADDEIESLLPSV